VAILKYFRAYGLPVAAVLAGHGLLLWGLVLGLAAVAPQPPELVVMAQILSAPVVAPIAAPVAQAEPAPPQTQPRPEHQAEHQPKKHQPPPLSIKPKANEPPAERTVAAAPEKTASSPVEMPKASTAQATSGAPTRGEASQGQAEVKPTLVGASSDLAKDYPPMSLRMGEEGTVLIGLEVGTDGSVTEASVLKTSGYPRLDTQATKAVHAAHFKPGTVNGKPVPMRVKLPIRYEIR